MSIWYQKIHNTHGADGYRGRIWRICISNLRRGSNMVGFNFPWVESGLNWNRFVSVQRGGLNSLNSVSDHLFLFRYSQNYLINGQKNDILVLKYQFVASNLFKNQRFLNYKLSEFSVSILDVLILKTISMLIARTPDPLAKVNST